jgi:hypothetical protein
MQFGQLSLQTTECGRGNKRRSSFESLVTGTERRKMPMPVLGQLFQVIKVNLTIIGKVSASPTAEETAIGSEPALAKYARVDKVLGTLPPVTAIVHSPASLVNWDIQMTQSQLT